MTKKGQKEEPIIFNYKFYKIVDGKKVFLKEFNLSIDCPKNTYKAYILSKEADLMVLNDMCGVSLKRKINVDLYLPKKMVRKKRIKKMKSLNKKFSNFLSKS